MWTSEITLFTGGVWFYDALNYQGSEMGRPGAEGKEALMTSSYEF